MSESNSQELLNKGIEEAHAGKLNEAIISFIEASNHSFHIRPISLRVKVGLEIMIFQNFCDAIQSSKVEDISKGKSKHGKFKEYLDSYNEICKKSSSMSERIRYQNTIEQLGKLTKLYQSQIVLLESD